MLKTEYLDNGLRVTLLELPYTKKTSISTIIHSGSSNDERDVLGLHHFAEHMPFRGTKNFPNKIALMEPIERANGYVNAWTNLTITDFYTELPATKFDLAATLISDLVFQPLTRPEDLNEEREIILQEEEGTRFDHAKVFNQLLLERVFAGTGMANRPIGFSDTIKNVTVEKILQMYRSEYTIANTDIIVTGCIPNNALELLNNTFGTIVIPKGTASLVKEPYKNHGCVNWDVEHELFGKTYLQIGHFTPQVSIREETILQFFVSMLSRGMTSPLFLNLREQKKLYYSSNTWASDMGPQLFNVGFRCQTNKKKVEEVKTAYWETVYSTFNNMERFAFAKDQRLISLSTWEPTPFQAKNNMVDDLHIRGTWIEIEELIRITESLTLEEVSNTAKKFFDPASSYTLSVSR